MKRGMERGWGISLLHVVMLCYKELENGMRIIPTVPTPGYFCHIILGINPKC